jgi:hypothetical protein
VSPVDAPVARGERGVLGVIGVEVQPRVQVALVPGGDVGVEESDAGG